MTTKLTLLVTPAIASHAPAPGSQRQFYRWPQLQRSTPQRANLK